MKLNSGIDSINIAKPAVLLSVDTVVVRFDVVSPYAVISYHFKNEDGGIVQHGVLEVTEEDLLGWGNDDTFVINLLKTKLNLA